MLKNYDRSALQTLNITGVWKKNVHNDRCDISSIYSARREQSDPCRNVDQHLQDNWATGRHKTLQTHVVLPPESSLFEFVSQTRYVSMLCYSCR